MQLEAQVPAAPGIPDRTIELVDPAATAALAGRLAGLARPRDVIALSGPLGAGKTEFARAFIRALARRMGHKAPAEVPSPTFTLVQTYRLGDFSVWHFDLYRLTRPEDAEELGLDEAFAEGISLIEWPERLGDRLPGSRLDLAFEYGEAPNARRATLAAHGAWIERLDRV